MEPQMPPALPVLLDPTNLRIVLLLAGHPHCTRAVAAALHLPPKEAAQRVAALRRAGMVAGIKRGRNLHYAVQEKALRELSVFFAELAASLPDGGEPGGRCQYSEQTGCRRKKTGARQP